MIFYNQYFLLYSIIYNQQKIIKSDKYILFFYASMLINGKTVCTKIWSTQLIIITIIIIFLEHEIIILQWFLKDHVTLKTEKLWFPTVVIVIVRKEKKRKEKKRKEKKRKEKKRKQQIWTILNRSPRDFFFFFFQSEGHQYYIRTDVQPLWGGASLHHISPQICLKTKSSVRQAVLNPAFVSEVSIQL